MAKSKITRDKLIDLLKDIHVAVDRGDHDTACKLYKEYTLLQYDHWINTKELYADEFREGQ